MNATPPVHAGKQHVRLQTRFHHFCPNRPSRCVLLLTGAGVTNWATRDFSQPARQRQQRLLEATHDGDHLFDDGWLMEVSMRWTPQRFSCVCLAYVCSFVPAFGVASQSWISPAKAGYANAPLPASNLDLRRARSLMS
jgi:hypothetical protein